MIIVHSLSLESLRETFEARASEWMLTGATLSLAFVFFLNIKMFYSEAFEGLREINNNRFFWSLTLFVVGAIRLSVLLINGSYYRTPHMRSITAFFCAGIWFMMIIAFARNGSMMIAIAPWIFFLDAYNTVRAAREAGTSEFRHRYIMKQGSANGPTRVNT
jgi:hypothetical protein